jgi:phenol 2-monooxygenase (NADPH)
MPHANMPPHVDVFICGSGPAGLCAAAWLARCGIRCKIVDARSGPLAIGQADGMHCRTVVIFESFGLVEKLLREGYHVIDSVFWNPDGNGRGVVRTRSSAATAPELSHLPRIILNQPRVHEILLEAMRRFDGLEVDYGYRVLGVEVDGEQADNPDAYPVVVRTEKDGKEEIFRAKYALVSPSTLIELAFS